MLSLPRSVLARGEGSVPVPCSPSLALEACWEALGIVARWALPTTLKGSA